ncbi:proapoptotic nucleolar protein 1, partial [Daubentonia madagascariensis]
MGVRLRVWDWLPAPHAIPPQSPSSWRRAFSPAAGKSWGLQLRSAVTGGQRGSGLGAAPSALRPAQAPAPLLGLSQPRCPPPGDRDSGHARVHTHVCAPQGLSSLGSGPRPPPPRTRVRGERARHRRGRARPPTPGQQQVRASAGPGPAEATLSGQLSPPPAAVAPLGPAARPLGWAQQKGVARRALTALSRRRARLPAVPRARPAP